MDNSFTQIIENFKGRKVDKAKLKENVLLLSFTKKVLFLTKTETLKIQAGESMTNLSTNAIDQAILKEISIDGKIITLVFSLVGEMDYTLSFRYSNIDYLKKTKL